MRCARRLPLAVLFLGTALGGCVDFREFDIRPIAGDAAVAIDAAPPPPIILQASFSVDLGARPTSLVSGDWNGDGHTDLALTLRDFTTHVQLFLGKGDGTFQPSDDAHGFSFFPDGYLAAGDLNGDGRTDLLLADRQAAPMPLGRVSVMLAVPTQGRLFQYPRTYMAGAQTTGPVIAELDGDGALDVATADPSTNRLLVFKGDRSRSGALADAVASTVDIDAGDLVRIDKRSPPFDIVLTHGERGTVGILLGTRNGELQPEQLFQVGREPSAIAVGDFNRDNHPDLAVADVQAGDVKVLLLAREPDRMGGETVRIREPLLVVPLGPAAPAARPVAIGVADMNHDGHDDLIVADAGRGSLHLLIGDYDGAAVHFALFELALRDRPCVPAPNDPGSCQLLALVADVDGDHRDDVVTCDAAAPTPALAVFLNHLRR